VADAIRRLFGALLLLAPLLAAADLPALVRQSKPAVVMVGTWSETDSPRFTMRGTGFAVGDGLGIVTNAHVLPPATETGKELRVMAWKGGKDWEPRVARVERLQRQSDLALLRIEGTPLPVLRLADGEPLAEGSDVALIGFPIGGLLGFSHATHRGVVAAVTELIPPQPSGRALNAAAVRQARDGSFPIYQLDIVAYPGNSGGPVFDVASGRVIAVLNMGLTKAGREGALSAPTGISYAIPVAQLQALLAR